MSGTEPLSSAALSSMIWDLDGASAEALFGDSPYDALVTPPASSAAFGKKLASVLDYMRQTVWPAIMDSANLTQIQVIYKSKSIDPTDILNVTTTETSFDVYGIVMGASQKNIERGLIVATDFECLIAAGHLNNVPAKDDAIRVAGTNYDIIGVLPCPQVPPAVGYRFFLRRAI